MKTDITFWSHALHMSCNLPLAFSVDNWHFSHYTWLGTYPVKCKTLSVYLQAQILARFVVCDLEGTVGKCITIKQYIMENGLLCIINYGGGNTSALYWSKTQGREGGFFFQNRLNSFICCGCLRILWRTQGQGHLQLHGSVVYYPHLCCLHRKYLNLKGRMIALYSYCTIWILCLWGCDG